MCNFKKNCNSEINYLLLYRKEESVISVLVYKVKQKFSFKIFDTILVIEEDLRGLYKNGYSKVSEKQRV